jgi:hypothetical protein
MISLDQTAVVCPTPEVLPPGSPIPFKVNEQEMRKVLVAGGGLTAAALVLGYLGGAIMVNGIVTGTMLMAEFALLAYYSRDKFPRILPFIVKHKEIIDAVLYFGTLFSFVGMGITAGIAMAVFGILLSIGFMSLKAIGYDEASLSQAGVKPFSPKDMFTRLLRRIRIYEKQTRVACHT